MSAARLRLAALLALAAAAPAARAATVIEKRVAIALRPDGTFSEQVRLAVRLEGAADAERWSRRAVALDVNRELRSFTASLTGGDGRELRAGRHDFDTVGGLGDGDVASSQRFRVVALPAGAPGDVYRFEWETEERPWFPGTIVELGEDAAIAALDVTLEAPGRDLRAELVGPAAGLALERTAAGVRVRGHLAAPPAGTRLPGELHLRPLLVAGWGAPGWSEVGRWFDGVTRTVPRDAPEVRAAAESIVAGAGSRREEVSRLLAALRRGVRYASVQIGIGGYRPAPAAETLARKWGDCKAKAFLLLDLLAARGVPAWPLVVRLSDDERPPETLATPYLFNHLVVAADAAAAGALAADPVVDGLLILDPTAERGGVEWLPDALQGQPALLVHGDASRLVTLPERVEQELVRTTLTVAIGADGAAAGSVRLEAVGSVAAALAGALAREPAAADGIVLAALGARLQGAELSRPTWSVDDRALPAVAIDAQIALRSLAEPTLAGPELALPGADRLPPARELAGRELPLPLAAGVEEVRWKVQLAAGLCPPEAAQWTVANAFGAVEARTLRTAGGFERVVTTRLERGWATPAAFRELRELAIAEARADRAPLAVGCRRD